MILCACKSIAIPLESNTSQEITNLPSVPSTTTESQPTQPNSTVEHPRTSEPTPFQSPLFAKLTNADQIDDRTWRKKQKHNHMQLLNDVFQVRFAFLVNHPHPKLIQPITDTHQNADGC